MDQIPCPDGYLLDAKSALSGGHHALNQYLVRVEEACWQTAIKEMNAIRDKHRKLEIWKALLQRMQWLKGNNPRSVCVSPLRGLAERIEKWTLAPAQADLIGILAQTADVAGFLAPTTPIPHLFAYIEANALTAELAGAIRTFRDRVYHDGLAVNQVSLQLFRSRLDMLAWRDEWTPVNLKRCWSERIRADFRAMQAAERDNWRRLLWSIHGDEGTRPAAKWETAATAAIQKIGPSAFRMRVAEWLGPLQTGVTQPLSREGSFLLRSFVWLAELSKDEELAARLPAIAEVNYKPKSNGLKVIRAVAEATGVSVPPADPRVPAPNWDGLVARALSAALSPSNALMATGVLERVEVSSDVVYVRGKMDSYEVHISGGAIFRQSDGRQVHITTPAPQHIPFGVPGLAGVMSVLSNVLTLVDDESHAAVLKAV